MLYKSFFLLFCRFFFPQGKPGDQTQLEMTILNLRQVFLGLPNQQATREQFAAVTKVSTILHNNILHVVVPFIGVGVSIYD